MSNANDPAPDGADSTDPDTPEPTGTPDSAALDGAAPDSAALDGAGPDTAEADTDEHALPEPADSEQPDSESADDFVPLPTPDPTTEFPPPPTDAAPLAYSDLPSGTAELPTADHGDPAGPADGPATDPIVVPAAPSRFRPWQIIVGVLTALLLLAVIAFGGVEWYARSQISSLRSCLADSISETTGSPTSVSMAGGWALPVIFNREMPWVQIDSEESTPETIALHVRAESVDFGGDTIDIGSVKGHTYAPYERIATLAQEMLDSGGESVVRIESVTGNPTDGTVTVEGAAAVILTVPISIVLRPVITDGVPAFEAVDARAFSIGLPRGLVQSVVDALSENLTGAIFGDLRADEIEVSDEGVTMQISGNDVRFTAAEDPSSATTC